LGKYGIMSRTADNNYMKNALPSLRKSLLWKKSFVHNRIPWIWEKFIQELCIQIKQFCKNIFRCELDFNIKIRWVIKLESVKTSNMYKLREKREFTSQRLFWSGSEEDRIISKFFSSKVVT
jgi:hypothetical protein